MSGSIFFLKGSHASGLQVMVLYVGMGQSVLVGTGLAKYGSHVLCQRDFILLKMILCIPV